MFFSDTNKVDNNIFANFKSYNLNNNSNNNNNNNNKLFNKNSNKFIHKVHYMIIMI